VTATTVLRPDDPPAAERDSRYPIVIQRVDGFVTAHTASFDAVAAALPTEALHPVRLPNGRALIAIAFYQKRAATAGSGASTLVMPPYADLTITAVVTQRPMSRVAAMLALAGLRGSGLGGFALQFPVTSRAWRDAARSTLGSPMFVADFDLDVGGSEWRLRVSENDQDIVTVLVRPGGGFRRIHDVQTVFGVVDRTLMAVEIESDFVAMRRRDGATLELGTHHPVAGALCRLDVSPRAFMTIVYHDGRLTLPAPVAIGTARPYPCHPGLDAPFGRYTVSYPGTPPIDQYAAGDLRRSPMGFDETEDGPRRDPGRISDEA
jgi:hypothetical protein